MMSTFKRMSLASAAVVAVAVFALAAGPRGEGPEHKAKEVSLTGRIVDLQCFMTDTYPSADKVKCTRSALQAGSAAALETADGVVILGMGTRGVQKKQVLAHAFEEVKLTGKLYEKKGLKYLDLTAVESSKPAGARDMDEDSDYEDEDEDYDSEDDSQDDDSDDYDDD